METTTTISALPMVFQKINLDRHHKFLLVIPVVPRLFSVMDPFDDLAESCGHLQSESLLLLTGGLYQK